MIFTSISEGHVVQRPAQSSTKIQSQIVQSLIHWSSENLQGWKLHSLFVYPVLVLTHYDLFFHFCTKRISLIETSGHCLLYICLRPVRQILLHLLYNTFLKIKGLATLFFTLNKSKSLYCPMCTSSPCS